MNVDLQRWPAPSRPHDLSYWQRECLQYAMPHPRLRRVAQLLRDAPARRLLDVGCGTAELRKLLGADFYYVGCDLVPLAAEVLGNNFVQVDFNTACDLSVLTAQRIEVVHIGGVLEYLSYPGQLLGEICRVTGPGTRLIATLVNFDSHAYRLAARHHARWIYKPSLPEFLELLASAGWRVRRVHPLPLRLRGWRRGAWQLNRWLRPASPSVWLNSPQVIVEAEADRTAPLLRRGSDGTFAGSALFRSAGDPAATHHSVAV